MGMLDSVLGAGVAGALGRGGAMRGGRGGMLGSPVVKALLVALAAKAAQEYMGRKRTGEALPSEQSTTSGSGIEGGLGGVLGDVLGQGQGGLGGLLGGFGGAGALGELLEQFNRRGKSGAVNSWVGTGANQPIAPEELADALGPDALAELEQETGLQRPQLLDELSRELPEAIDQITPEGRLPTEQELLGARPSGSS